MVSPEIKVIQLPEEIEPQGPYGLVEFRLFAGNKELHVVVGERNGRLFSTSKIVSDNSPKLPGTTTALYKRAHEILRKIATVQSLPITMQFWTQNPELKNWARDPTKGMGIFDWDEVQEDKDALTAIKTIFPQNN